MAVTIADIEDGILHAIRTDAALSAYVKDIASYAGQLEDELAYTPHRFPAVFVMFISATYEALTQFEEQGDFTFGLVCVDHSLRGNTTARRGTPSGGGTYQLLSDLRRLLVGNTLGLGLTDVLPMWLQSETALVNTKALSIYEARYVMRGAIILQGT
jgi:phage gp37-like protein